MVVVVHGGVADRLRPVTAAGQPGVTHHTLQPDTLAHVNLHDITVFLEFVKTNLLFYF